MASVEMRQQVDADRSTFFRRSSGTRTLLLCLALMIPAAAIYYPVHTHPFCSLDDPLYVINNDALHHGINWATIWWSFRTLYMVNWIPLTWLSHALDYQLFGLNPAGHHLVNVALHALNAALLFWVLKRATGYVGRSFLVAALFAIHPMNVEPVVWVAERKTLLSTLFFLLALEAYRRYALAPRTSRYLAMMFLFGMGLLAKPQIITFPCVLLLWDYWPLRRMVADQYSKGGLATEVYPPRSLGWLLKEKIPLLVLCAFDALMAVFTQRHSRFKPPLLSRLDNAIYSYWLYVKKAFWPTAMAPEYPHLGAYLRPWQVMAALAFLVLVTILVLRLRRYRYLPVGWFWFLGTLVPTIGIMQVGLQGMADRYVYEAYIGIFMMVCWGFSDWAQPRRVPTAWLAGAGGLALLALAPVTARQITYWQNEYTLWGHAAEVVKYDWLAHDNFAVVLRRMGRDEEAWEHIRRAAEINPTDSFSHSQLARREQEAGNLQQALVDYHQALLDEHYLQSQEDKAKVWLNMAVIYSRLGDSANAELCLQQARALQSAGE